MSSCQLKTMAFHTEYPTLYRIKNKLVLLLFLTFFSHERRNSFKVLFLPIFLLSFIWRLMFDPVQKFALCTLQLYNIRIQCVPFFTNMNYIILQGLSFDLDLAINTE